MDNSSWLFERTCTDREACLRTLLVSLVPSAFLVLFAPARLWILLRGRRLLAPELTRNWLYFVKLTTLILLLFISLAQLVLAVDLLLLRISNTVALLIAAVLHHVEYTRNPAGSGILLFYWLSVLIVNGMQWWNRHWLDSTQHNSSSLVLFEATWMLSLAMLILESCNRPTHASIILKLEKDHSPCSTANVFERLLFSWASPLIQLPDLEMDDLWLWQDSSKSDAREVRIQETRSGFARTLISIAPGLFVLSGLLHLAHGVAQVILPVLLWRLLQWVTTHTAMIQSLPEPLYQGVFLAGAMFVASIAQSLLQQQCFHISSMMGMRVFSTLATAIYRKVLLTRQNNLKAELSTSEPTNLVLKDAQRIKEACNCIHMVWNAPLQMACAFASAQYILGFHVWAGMGIILVAVPVHILIGSRMRQWRSEQLTHKQSRIKLLGSILEGIKAIKLYAWESTFAQKVSAIRNAQELGTFRKIGALVATESAISNSITFLVSLAVFVTYALTTSDPLTTNKIFVCLALFRLLQYPSSAYPNALSAVRRASASMRRINQYITALDVDTQQHITYEDYRRMSNWTPCVPLIEMNQVEIPTNTLSSSSAPVEPINLHICKGEVVGVIGHSSAIIDAILGNVCGGQLTVRGSIAYVSSTPWIMHDASLCDNVVFGQRWEPDFYRSVLDLCEIPHDAVPSQHASKVELARALYCRADIYIFDNPSCLDRQLFQRIVLGILRTKTRVVATRSFSHLHQLNRILMASSTGEIVMDGSFGDLMSRHHARLYQVMADSNARETNNGTTMAKVPQPLPPTTAKQSEDGEEPDPRSLASLGAYFKACSVPAVLAVVVLQAAAQSVQVGSRVWLQTWEDGDARYYLGVYAALGACCMLLEWAEALLLWVFCAARAAGTLHGQMLIRVLRSPLTFFESTTPDMVLSRFNQDQDVADRLLPKIMHINMRISMLIAATAAVIACSTPFFLLIVIPLGFLYIYLQRQFLACHRQLKRLDHEAKSALYIHLAESASGASTIRAYNQQQRFSAEYMVRLNDTQRVHFATMACNRWVAVRIEILGSLVALAAAMLAVVAVVYSPSVDVGLVGLSLFYALGIPQSLTCALRTYSEIEMHSESLERLHQYTELPDEKDDSGTPPPGMVPVHLAWPVSGKIDFAHYTAHPFHDLSLSINAGETISIIGADKRAFAENLFQLAGTPHSGSLQIDGIDICRMDVSHLRSRIAWVGPEEESMLFEGTVRENLDPMGCRGDLTLWDILASVRLEIHSGLDAPIEEQCFSASERYLFCLARALLRRPRVLVLEEPSTMETAALTQQIIREHFKKCTVLIVTHRHDTIMESDRVLVVDNGALVDFATPQQLLKCRGSLLSSLADTRLC